MTKNCIKIEKSTFLEQNNGGGGGGGQTNIFGGRGISRVEMGTLTRYVLA